MKIIVFILFIAGWFNGTTFAISEQHGNQKTKISIFMASDNNLYPYAKKDLKEISNYFVQNENALDVHLIFERPGKSYQTTNTTMDRMSKVLGARQERINQRLILSSKRSKTT